MHTNLEKQATCDSCDSKVIKYSGIFYLINLCKYAFVGKSVVFLLENVQVLALLTVV